MEYCIFAALLLTFIGILIYMQEYKCWHSYKTVREIILVDDDDFFVGTKYIQACTRCGDIRNRKV